MAMISGGWLVREARGEPTQVIPLDDLRPHSTDDPCWCKPFIEDGIVVHNSMDGREQYEAGRKPS